MINKSNNHSKLDGLLKSDNINLIIGILVVVTLLWAIFDAIPSLISSLFHTFLGNIILVFCAIFTGMVNPYAGILAFAVFVILYQITHAQYAQSKEGFTSSQKWSPKTVSDFLKFQQVTFPNTQFNMNIIQDQASEKEAQELIKTGIWKWSKETQDLYKTAVSNNDFIKIDPGIALDEAMKLYNETAARLILSWNTKEGDLLLSGIDLGASKYEPLFIKDPKHDYIRCVADKNNNFAMEKTSYFDTDYFSGLFNIKREKIQDSDIPAQISGFQFIGKSCNPCGPLNNEPDYTCPFKLNIKADNMVSPVWNTLWKL